MQIEGRDLIFIMNFSVLEFFKFASRMPQIAQILVSTFKNFPGEHAPGPPPPPPPLTYFLFFVCLLLFVFVFFFPLAIPGSGGLHH